LATGGAVLALGLAGSALATPITGPFEVDDGTDSFAIKGYTYTSANATGVLGYGGNAGSTNTTGVAGYVTSPLSVGVTGYAASTGVNAYGVYGFSNTGPGVYGKANNIDAASVYGVNTLSGGTAVYGSSVGDGVVGQSSAANGVVGETFSTSAGFAAVYGADNSTNGFNSGVIGTTLNGNAVYGRATGTGFAGYFVSNSADAVHAYSSGSALGGYFYSASGTALEGYSPGIGGVGQVGLSSGEGGDFEGYSGTAAHPALIAVDGAGGSDLFGTYGHSGGETFIVQSNTFNYSSYARTNGSDVQISGDLYVQGGVYDYCSYLSGSFPVTSSTVSGHCYTASGITPALQKTSTGSSVTAYAPHQSVPTMEDVGEGRLVNGQATVPLERTFASTIDTSRPYLVFITPEGDSRGLYVSTRSLAGFVVRESMNGHSNVAFQYRIVAHPYEDASARLPVAQTTATMQQHLAPLPQLQHRIGRVSGQQIVKTTVTHIGHVPQQIAPPNVGFLKH